MHIANKDITTYIVSLPQAVQRRRSLREMLERANIEDYTFFDATYGPALLPEQIKDTFSQFTQYLGHPYVYGCAFSHIRLWREVVRTNRTVLCFEDDVVIEDDFKEKLALYLQDTPRDFDMLYLGGIQCALDGNIPMPSRLLHYLVGFGKPEFKWITDKIFQPRVILATHAYIVTPEGAKKLLNSLVGRIYTHIDFSIMTVPNLNFYVVHPYIAHQRVSLSESTIVNPTQFPFSINRKLDMYAHDTSGVTWAYVTGTPVSQFCGQNINAWTGILLLIGLILMIWCKDFLTITIVYSIWVMLDMMIESVLWRDFHLDSQSLRSLIFSGILVSLPLTLFG